MHQTLELSCGTKSFRRVAHELGYSIWTIDLDPAHRPDLVADLLSIESNASERRRASLKKSLVDELDAIGTYLGERGCSAMSVRGRSNIGRTTKCATF
jgi:hypothetical protein